MRFSLFFLTCLVASGNLVAQDCDTFAATLEQYQQQARTEAAAPANVVGYLYTLDKKLIDEAELRTMCSENLQLDRIMYRPIEGSDKVQAWIRLQRAPSTSATDKATFMLSWVVSTKTANLEQILQHPYFHMERQNEAGQQELLFVLPEIDLENDVVPDDISEVTVWKKQADIKALGVRNAEGVVVLAFKSERAYRKFLNL